MILCQIFIDEYMFPMEGVTVEMVEVEGEDAFRFYLQDRCVKRSSQTKKGYRQGLSNDMTIDISKARRHANYIRSTSPKQVSIHI